MIEQSEKAFLNERLTFRLDVLAQEAISANDAIFVKAVGCTIREVRVLRLIDDHPGTTFIEICRTTGLERSLASRIIRRLLAWQLVRRDNDAADARRFGLSTTSLGKHRRTEARGTFRQSRSHSLCAAICRRAKATEQSARSVGVVGPVTRVQASPHRPRASKPCKASSRGREERRELSPASLSGVPDAKALQRLRCVAAGILLSLATGARHWSNSLIKVRSCASIGDASLVR